VKCWPKVVAVVERVEFVTALDSRAEKGIEPLAE
jgi:hypothetical protein